MFPVLCHRLPHPRPRCPSSPWLSGGGAGAYEHVTVTRMVALELGVDASLADDEAAVSSPAGPPSGLAGGGPRQWLGPGPTHNLTD